LLDKACEAYFLDETLNMGASEQRRRPKLDVQ
jgi:hypothetical protein